MPELSVAVFATDSDQRAVLQVLVDGTSVARIVYSASRPCLSPPTTPSSAERKPLRPT